MSDAVYKLYKKAHKRTKLDRLSAEGLDYWAKQARLHAGSKEPERFLAFDTETTGLTFGVPSYLRAGKTDVCVPNPQVFGLSMCLALEDELLLLWGRIQTELFDAMVDTLAKPGLKCAHNLRYDLKVCAESGIEVAPETHDTLTMARIFWDRRRSFKLQRLSEFMCVDMSDWEEGQKAEWTRVQTRYTRRGYPKGYCNYSHIPDRIMGKYSMADSFMCWILNVRLWPEVRSESA